MSKARNYRGQGKLQARPSHDNVYKNIWVAIFSICSTCRHKTVPRNPLFFFLLDFS